MPANLTSLLTPEEASSYERHLAHYRKLWNPVGEHEESLVGALANAWWRLARIPVLEEALYRKGARQFEEKAADLPAEARPAMLRLETYLAYEKQFRNIASEERHLAKYAAQLKTELEIAQKTRDRKEAQNFAVAATLYKTAQTEGKTYDPEQDGFEFSIDDLEAYLRGQHAADVARTSSSDASFRLS